MIFIGPVISTAKWQIVLSCEPFVWQDKSNFPIRESELDYSRLSVANLHELWTCIVPN